MFRNTVFPLLCTVIILAGCTDNEAVVDPVLDRSTMVLTGIQLSGYVFDTDTLDVLPGRDKSDSDPIVLPLTLRVTVSDPGEVGELRYRIRYEGRTEVLHEGALQLSSVGDVYEAAIAFDRRRGDVGEYRIDAIATDQSGVTANSAHAKFRVLFGNRPPEIVTVNAPDTVDLQAETIYIRMSAEVRDESGLADIKQVFFNSFLPDGRPSSGNPFTLRDDGNPGSGDDIAGDGIFSIIVQMPPATPHGEYRFEFRAIDYSNLTSNVVIHKLIVR
ncbi:MAG: hypothetical protein KFH87_00455 [Bacteroidetes bacterium]|nr:hypothetical protein [Bacteroidota bacterium]